MGVRMRRNSNAGFSLIETIIAVAIVAVGVLSLAAMLASGLAYMAVSQNDYIAQEKAAEAVESIFTARDMGQATWSTICNVGSSICSGGIFIAGAKPLCGPGADGIIDTADDYNSGACAGGALAQPDAIIIPASSGGAVNVNLTAAPTSTTGGLVPLSNWNFLRTIAITNALDGSGNVIPNLRQIQVTITYTAARFQRQYVLTTNISNFS